MLKPNNLPVTFGKNNVKIIAQKTLYRGFFSLNLYKFRHRLFNKQISHKVRQKIFKRGHAAVLLPFNPVRNKVVLIKQIQIAAYNTSKTPWLLKMVAKIIKKGKSVKNVARRKAIKKAKLIVKQTKPVLSFLASPGGTSKRSSIMVGKVNATTASGIHGLANKNKNIRVHVISQKQTYQWVKEKKINNAASVIALQWLQLHHQALKNK